uniref:Peptidase M48 domain-containing protein n=1 Tax=Globisporangium ultimum (strain ATCC 200006 / CBS 805.95 / DAOM BR144) TaxID=431595 RepID=K3W615_GLOUD
MKWQFHVIESPEPNAFCLPGGKVFVNSGLFKVLRNEDSLAAVLFHEAAHGIARHGAEKVSFSLLIYGLLALIFPDYGQLSDLLVKVAVDLPFSRKLELEADSIGLRLMAKACYDPRASIQMNASLGQLEKKNPAAQFKYFSTHPPSAERVKALREQLRDAVEIYEASDCFDRKKSFFEVMKEIR